LKASLGYIVRPCLKTNKNPFHCVEALQRSRGHEHKSSLGDQLLRDEESISIWLTLRNWLSMLLAYGNEVDTSPTLLFLTRGFSTQMHLGDLYH
jgi:hypothetical protein